METLTQIKRPSTEKLLKFITTYRRMEKSGLVVTDRIMISIIAESVAQGSKIAYAQQHKHLMSHWKGKKKGFGQFFLNISWKSKLALLVHWGVLDKYDDQVVDFLAKVESIQHYQFLNRPEGKVLQFSNMVLMFENHGINHEVCSGITLNQLPSRLDDRFGNSANWGKYILSLSEPQQEKFFDDLFTNYHG